ncbi:MAG: hypothetical protein ACAH80_07490 [Alphaproteobacteria bacterium]
MNQQEKNELTTWSVVGLLAVALVIGVVYVNRNAAENYNDISPAAGTSTTEGEPPAYTPTSPVENPAEPQPSYP